MGGKGIKSPVKEVYKGSKTSGIQNNVLKSTFNTLAPETSRAVAGEFARRNRKPAALTGDIIETIPVEATGGQIGIGWYFNCWIWFVFKICRVNYTK